MSNPSNVVCSHILDNVCGHEPKIVYIYIYIYICIYMYGLRESSHRLVYWVLGEGSLHRYDFPWVRGTQVRQVG